jgi:hypothetical protein
MRDNAIKAPMSMPKLKMSPHFQLLTRVSGSTGLNEQTFGVEVVSKFLGDGCLGGAGIAMLEF